LPGVGLTERVFSREDFIEEYANSTPATSFELLHLEKETHYTKFNGRSYKRNFWVAYLRKSA
jgi:hypothetical protein